MNVPELKITDEDRGPMIIGVSAMVMILATFCIGLRSWVRARRRVPLGQDDWWLFVTFFFLWVHFTVIAIEVVHGGLGVPVLVNYRKDPSILTRFLKILFAHEIISPLVITLTKGSVLAMYWRLFPTRFTSRGCIILGVVLVVWCLAAIFPSIFRCNPVHKAWSPFMSSGSCSKAIGDWIAWQDGIPELATTIIIFAMPIYEVGRLKATLRTKIAVSAVFLVGSLTVISSIMRFVLAHKAHVNETTIGGGDPTLEISDVLLWSQIEVCTGFIAACLPALRPVGTIVAGWIGLSGAEGSGPVGTSDRRFITIGGSEQPSNGKSRFYLPGSSKPSQRSGPTALAQTAGESSTEQLRDPFWPEGYASESQVIALGSSGNTNNEQIPLESIGVKTEIEWQKGATTSRV